MRESVRIVFFPQVAAAPVLIAHQQGFFERQGLNANLIATPDSAHLVTGLVEERYDIGVALADNFVAYQAGQHTVPRKQGQDLAIAMGLAKVRASLVVKPEISYTYQLAGRRIGVDAPQTGFALMLRRILQDAGLTFDQVQLVRSGSTSRRLSELIKGTIDATILTPEFVAIARESGCRVCTETEKDLDPYLGMAVGVNRQWAARHRKAIARCIQAIQLATRWIATGDNRSTVVEAVAVALGISLDIARGEIDRLCDSGDLITNDTFGSDLLSNIVNLRRRFISPTLELVPDDIMLDNRPVA